MSALPAAHVPSPAHRSSFPDSSGAELPITSSSERLTCCRPPRSAALPSSGTAQPASGVPGEKTTISFMKTHPNWGRISNQGIQYHSWAIQHIHFQKALYSLIHLILITRCGVWVLLLLFPFYREKKMRPKILNNLSRITQLSK